MAEYLSKKDALASVNGLFAQPQTNSFNSGFEEAAQRTAASLKKFEQQQANKSVQPIVTPQMPKATTRQPTPQQTANYNKLQELVAKSNPIQTNTQALASGRDFAVMPNVETGGRIGAGLKSIGQSAKAALPMLGSTAAQAAENVAAAADSKDYAAKRAQLFMLQNGLSNIPEYDKRKAAEEEAKTALQNVVNAEQLNKPVSPDSVGMQMMRAAKESQQRAVEGLSPTGQFIGNTLISIGQNAAMLPAAAINPSLPLVGMGAIAAADKAYELSEQGVGAGEALTRGAVAGGIEALTEKIPLDNLLKMAKTPAGKSILETLIKQSGKQAAGESIEEAVSYALNYAADALARDPNAKFSWQDLGMAALGGAVSGGIMGGGASAFGSYVNGNQPVIKNAETVVEPEEIVVESKENPANPQTIGDMQGNNKAVKVGRATTIYNPYNGETPVKLKNSIFPVDVSEKAYNEAAVNIKNSQAAAAAEGKSIRGFLTALYERIFEDMGGVRGVAVKNATYKNEPYIVTLNKNSVSKVISDKNLSAEKLAVFDNIDEIIEQGDYVGSGEYIPKGNKVKQTIRFDYFETPIKIGNGEYVVTFDVEVYPGKNNYRTHKVINNLDLVSLTSGEAGPVPAAQADKPSPIDFILPQQQNESNNNISTEQPNNVQLNEKPQTLQDVLYRLGERGHTITQGGENVTAGERSGAFEQRKMREYGVDNADELIAVMSPEDFEAYEARRAQDDEESFEALMYDINRDEMARRTRTATKAPNEKTAEMLSNVDNGIIASDSINESAQMLTATRFAHNKTLAQNLDDSVRGAKGDLPLLPNQLRQLRDMLYNAFEKPLNMAKAAYTEAIKRQVSGFAKEMDALGIKAGSNESAAVQWIGEGQRQGPDGQAVEYTLADLQQQFPDKWQDIIKASEITRRYYDEYIDRINEALRKVYPDVERRAAELADRLNARIAYNSSQAQIWLDRAAQLEQRAANAAAETHKADSIASAKAQERANRLNDQAQRAREAADRYTRAANAAEQKAMELQRKIESGEIFRNKRLMPRKDYFHHFNEMEEGIGGFINIITGSHDISAQLAGKSEFTKPKSKWWGALQRRNGGRYTADAVGGMARYIPAAEYKIAFDPVIAQMRGNIEALVNVTEKTQNANGLIEYLTDWTNDLAGKTNFLDRPIQKLFDRRSMKALEWLNNRAKANAVAGNIGSAIVQIGNIPNAMMLIKNPVYFAKAQRDIATGKSKEAQSVFLNERYIDKELNKLKKTSLASDFTNWMLEVGDKYAARLIWNAAYDQYESGNATGLRSYENAVDYADDITRRAIAGRGVGELPLTQKSRVIKLLAPFQVEVNNTFNLLAEKMGEKDALALLEFAVGNWAINSLISLLTGNRSLFDPIDALIDAIKGAMDEDEEDDRTTMERVAGAAQRIGGEIVSNMPYAATAATLLTGKENSEKIFGEADPTRYGTGNIAVQSLTKPIGQFMNGENIDLMPWVTNFALPYGGKQIERTVKGAQALGWLPDATYNTKDGLEVNQNQFGVSRSASGRVRFPITKPSDQLKALALGEWSTSRGREYIDKGYSPLSEKQSKAMEEMFAAGISPDEYYDAVIASKQAKKKTDSNGKTIDLSEDKDKVRLIRGATPDLTEQKRKLIYAALGISKNAY